MPVSSNKVYYYLEEIRTMPTLAGNASEYMLKEN